MTNQGLASHRKGRPMTERFTETLRRASEPEWSAAVQHRFVRELCDGTIPDTVMGAYLVQDHRFLDAFLTLLGGAIASADGFQARLRLGRFAGMVSGDENDYFLRSFAALGISDAARAAIRRLWADRIHSDDKAPQHPKSALQEWAAAAGRRGP